MKTINIEETKVAEFVNSEVEKNVQLIKDAIGHLDRDVVNIVLMSALVENCHHHAKQSDEFKPVAAEAEEGFTPTLGGGEIHGRCGEYNVKVEIRHGLADVVQAMEKGENPMMDLLQVLMGGDDDCDCPNCEARRAAEKPKPH